ncbi:VWA N-terminal [Nesidiocoris tenuis]|uniref:VWA N-terminal n=1 Tax=Nesidiocoris tenuis TaxID=355587 RepID=A0ABN7AGG0_9HEMI|nr:VWA N-terminal [Nesidiocoris tenuis]
MWFNKFFIVWTLILGFDLQCDSKEDDIVEAWASKLGDELWQLGVSVTRVKDIKTSYKRHNARVLPTDGEGILNSIVSNVNKLLKGKMDSVNCVIEAAERLANDFEDDNSTYIYFSSKFSSGPGIDEFRTEDDEEVPGVNLSYYREMDLRPDYHFYDYYVNTSFSAVHVPTDVYDQGLSVRGGLKWSLGLDEVFRKNYLADPTMSWQYFGSSTGFLRHYPALHWGDVSHDTFDCRTRFWYIEAATCTKDVVILVDNSGSMYGMRDTIARLTINTILDTFSNNDFINILSFNNTLKNIVSCFPDDMLVQATPENIQVFKEAVNGLQPEDKADFKQAFEFALKLLNKTRENKTCPDDICNQAIMLVTDGLPDNITDVMEKYNWFENRTRIPVRVFTYLIGKEVLSMKEIQNLACQNRGYSVHIKDLEEVRSQVLKYISVIARPLVLQAVEHPLSWTHSFVDATANRAQECFCPLECAHSEQEYRFMTSVSGPAFDTEANSENGTRKAELLGVAGTDVLISDIKSLTLPYKIGANGYAFVVTNNGYVLFHPDLRPVYDKCLKRNYNSVDLSEIEHLDDSNETPRSPSPEILELREAMLLSEGGTGKKTGLKIKFHYDNFRRVGVETRNYYFAPLANTPFYMGLVLPDSYGDFWIKAGDEILRSKQMGIPLTNYFKGNWRVHPDWVYCDYHRNGDKHFPSAEEKLHHFLEKIFSPYWQWKDRLQEETPGDNNGNGHNCDRPIVDEDSTFCDKELMQLLVFDAKITEGSYKSSKWAARDRTEEELVMRFNASLRFVATQSGLTRWQQIPDQENGDYSWGDKNKRALDEVWYRSAVLHHHLDPEAFVFSVPYDSGSMEDIKVTASHAIFPRDGGHEAPGSVVGFQIAHSALYKRFREITSKPNCHECTLSCESDELDCYVIDGNGYVVISEEKNDTGRFFGDVEGAVMDAMINKNIFRAVFIQDYQGICSWEEPVASDATRHILTPFHLAFSAIQWLLSQIVWNLLRASYYLNVFADDDSWYGEIGSDPSEPSTEKPIYVYFLNIEKPTITVHLEACDKQGKLYMLQHLSKEGYSSEVPINCSRPFYVKRLPHTNLLLIVVNTLHQSCFREVSNRMEKIEYDNPHDNNSTPSCNKLNLNYLPRRPLTGCFNYHPMEMEIIQCGTGNPLLAMPFIYLVALSLCVHLLSYSLNIE